MNGRETLLLALAMSLFASAVAAQQSEFVARGNEPGWVLRMSDVGLTFHPMGGAPATISPPPAVEIVNGVEVYRSTIDGQPFKLTVARKLCVDSMSGMPYPASVSVEVGETRSDGCGGEPKSLLQRRVGGGLRRRQTDRHRIGNHPEVRRRWTAEWRCFLQQIFRRFHADGRRPDHFEARCDEDDVRATPHGPGRPLPHNFRNGYAVRDWAGWNSLSLHVSDGRSVAARRKS